MIKGGYILQPRIIQESELMKWGPCVREIWFWMLRKANHADNETAERGCFHFMQKDIQDDLCWYVGYRRETYSKDQITKAVRKLCEGGMIETTKATRGMFCKVLKYSYYQDPKNYEGNHEGNTKATRRQHEVLADKQERKNVRTEESFEPKGSCIKPEQIAELFPKTKISKTVPKLNEQRRKHIKARIKEDCERNDIKFWDDYFTKVSEIGFLHGDNDRGWKATFDWLINSTNMLKVLEGNYADGQQTTQATKKPTRPMMTEKEQNSCPHFFEFLQKKITLAEVTRRTGKFFPDDQYLRCDGKPYSEEPDGEVIEIEAEEEEETESIFSKGFGVLDLSGKMPF